MVPLITEVVYVDEPFDPYDRAKLPRIKAEEDPSWRSQARCFTHYSGHLEWWFDGRKRDRAIAICKECPVMGPCLNYAVKASVTDGVWGGLAPDQVKVIIKERMKRVPQEEED